MPKLPMLKPRLQTLPDRLATLKPARATKRTGRDADAARTLKLNGAAWQRLRKSVLQGEPLCRHCTAEGKTVLATDVDHMNGADDNRLESLQPLCHRHHSIKTAREQGKAVVYGCDADGMPLDPAHPWRIAIDAEKSRGTERP